ncbi:MAG: response regulator transcription factor [Mariprofundaceae bacterium]
MSIRVQVIDNLALVQAGLRAVLANMLEVGLIDSFECGAQCADGCVNHQPDVLILALSLEGRCNLECVHRIASRHPKVNILVLTDVEDSIMASRVLRAGAKGYLAKASKPKRLARAIRAVAGGKCMSIHRSSSIWR